MWVYMRISRGPQSRVLTVWGSCRTLQNILGAQWYIWLYFCTSQIWTQGSVLWKGRAQAWVCMENMQLFNVNHSTFTFHSVWLDMIAYNFIGNEANPKFTVIHIHLLPSFLQKCKGFWEMNQQGQFV